MDGMPENSNGLPKLSSSRNAEHREGGRVAPQALTILLVEDRQEDADAVRRALNPPDHVRFDVEHCTSVEDALVELQQSTFAAALLDLNLPDSNGVDTIAAVRKRFDGPVVILSSFQDET